MKELSYSDFNKTLSVPAQRVPLYGQIELTYRCPCDCVHCYCRNQPQQELAASFWTGVIDQVQALGGIELTLTGGDALIYKDFPQVYRHAKNKGFLVNIFTSGTAISKTTFDVLEELPPFNIEITLNSIDPDNYERITGKKGVFDVVMKNIREIQKRGLPLVLKCNGLKENKHEIITIKKFTERLLGKGKFKFDSFVFPGLDRDEYPKLHRLSPQEIMAIEASDSDMMAESKKDPNHQSQWFNPDGLYHCNSWFNQYFISPQGILQACHLTRDCATDLKKVPFKEGFDRFLGLLDLKYKTGSKCIACELKEICYKCPARAFLETGSAESPVPYYCELAQARKNGIRAEV
jgi:radical SAM protein with 4Fe4S-binding SPASM domain